jgi:hypothetical protein
MKKILLITLFLSMLAGHAQHNKQDFGALSPGIILPCNNEISTPPVSPLPAPVPSSNINGNSDRDFDIVNPIEIGQSGNAFGFAFMRTTYLWADDNINTVTFIHRMMSFPGTGFLAYDISTNRGLNWTNNVQTYDPTFDEAYDARYPQGAIYNPDGNTDPDQAFFHFFAPTLDGSNTGSGTNWGGYAFGVKQLSEGSVPVQHNRTSEPPYYQYLPSAFTITQTGQAWMVDQNAQGDPTTYNYLGNLIIGRGLWNESTLDFDYMFDMLPLDINPERVINDIKIAFAPDGMTGYICLMTELPSALPYTSYHPILLKTTDGGDSWSDPIEVQLGGEDGLAPVQEFISDEILASYYDPEPVPPRDEVPYYMGYECDLAVDAWGNPHISGMVCITDLEAELIYTSEGLISMFHIWSDDQGQTWRAFNLADLKRFKAEFVNGDATISQFNRPQVATTMDGAIVFFSWLDTESPDIEDNSQPDIYFREYLPTLDEHGESAVNVTFLSAAMWTAYFGCMSHYVFTEVSENEYTCTIPFVYTQLTANDPTQPAQFYYIPDFVRSYVITGDKEIPRDQSIIVSQNYPNPFAAKSILRINLLNNSDIKLEVYDLAGNLVFTNGYPEMKKGIHDLEINAEGLSSGIYFYSLKSGTERITRKMVVL